MREYNKVIKDFLSIIDVKRENPGEDALGVLIINFTIHRDIAHLAGMKLSFVLVRKLEV